MCISFMKAQYVSQAKWQQFSCPDMHLSAIQLSAPALVSNSIPIARPDFRFIINVLHLHVLQPSYSTTLIHVEYMFTVVLAIHTIHTYAVHTYR